MNWKQFLTENVLKEPEATSEYTVANNGDLVSVKTVIKNRTFDNRNDLMDLYQKVYEGRKWNKFREFCAGNYNRKHITGKRFITWLFCLDGKNYEPHCKMVAEFYGWEEGK